MIGREGSMRLVNEIKTFKNNKEKLIYDIDLIMQDSAVIDKKIKRLNTLKSETVFYADLDNIDAKLIIYKKQAKQIEAIGNQLLQHYLVIAKLEDELEMQRQKLADIVNGKLNFIYMDSNQIKLELKKKIEQLENEVANWSYE